MEAFLLEKNHFPAIIAPIINTIKSQPRKCHECNSELIFVKSWKEKASENSQFFQTVTIYRCSNQSCQEEKDRQEEKRKKAVLEREERLKNAAEEKIKLKKSKIEELNGKKK